MTPETRQRLRELAEKATPGPWHQYVVTGEYVKAGKATVADCRYKNGKADAAYIAAVSPEVVLELLDAPIDVERLADTVDMHWLDLTDTGVGCSCGDWFFALSDDHPAIEVGDHFRPFSKHVATAIAAEYAADTGATE